MLARRTGRATARAVRNPAGRAGSFTGPDFAKIIDLEMLFLPGGRERTEAEFRALFAAAGLDMTRIVATGAPLSVIEAR